MRLDLEEKLVYGIGIFLIIFAILAIGIWVYEKTENEKNFIPEGKIVNTFYSPKKEEIHWSGKTIIHTYSNAIYKFQLEGEKDDTIVLYWTKVPEEDYLNYSIGDWYTIKEK